MKLFYILSPLLLVLPGRAGSFDEYAWRLGFLVAQDYYQVYIKFSYDYRSDSGFDPAAIALPADDNLVRFKLAFKVDGQKAEPIQVDQTTWWSHGRVVPTWLPDREGQHITAEGVFFIKNLFLIPPAPTSLPIPAKRLEVGFAPVPGFELTGTFIGPSYKFKHRNIAARTGEPPRVYGVWRQNVPAATTPELLYLIPKSFTFSFENLRAVQWDPKQAAARGAGIGAILGGTGGQNAGIPGAGSLDITAGHKGFSVSGDLKSYSANFYTGNPYRDWQFALTWLQQERTYLPLGIATGGSKGHSLFSGAGDSSNDLLPWINAVAHHPSERIAVTKALAQPDLQESLSQVDRLDDFLADYRKTLQVNPRLSHLVAYTLEGRDSPAMANQRLANAIVQRFQLQTAPVLTTAYPLDRAVALPLSAFDAVITGVKIGKNWFFVDIATPNWNVRDALAHLRGHSVVILDADQFKIATL